MPINITMPALSPTMEEGNLAKWLVKEGDTVSAGDVIAEIETDKATMEVEAVDEGTVGKIVVEAGTEGVKVNDLIAVLLEDGEDASAIDTSGGAAPAASAPSPAPAADAGAKEIVPVGAEAATDPIPAPKAADRGRIFASPLARRLAQINGLDLKALSGSGPHGRIVKKDIEAAVAAGTGKAAAAPAAAEAPKAAAAPAAGPSSDQVLKLFEEGSYELVPHDNMRKTIARRLVEERGVLALPDCREPIRFDAFVDGWDQARSLVFCDEDHETDNPLERLAPLRGRPLGLLIGPEGGFSDAERARLRALAFVAAIPLGPRILRADTAAVAALAVLQAAAGDW